MYENSNQDVLRELTQDNYRSHKTRNRLGIMAIALTTILITAVLTVGISVTTTALNYGESARGQEVSAASQAQGKQRSRFKNFRMW